MRFPFASGAPKVGLLRQLARPLHGTITNDPYHKPAPPTGYVALAAGAPPARIARPFDVRGGQIGLNQRGWPTTQEDAFIGHVPAVHVVQGIVPAATPTFDDTAHIPAVFAGNPLP